MARAPDPRSASNLLRDAIDDSKATIGAGLVLLVGIGALVTVLSFFINISRMRLLTTIPTTLSTTTLISATVLFIVGGAMVVALKMLIDHAVASITGFLARRLALPAVLATAQRAGRPEAMSGEVLDDIETIRTTLDGRFANLVLGVLLTPLLLVLVFALHWALGVMSVVFCGFAALLSLLMARASTQAAVISGGATTRSFGLAASAMQSGEAVLAMGMLPRLASQWVAQSTEGSAEAWAASQSAERLRTALEIVLGLYRGALMFTMVGISLAGSNINVLLGPVAMLVPMIMGPFASFGGSIHKLTQARAAWRRLSVMVAGTAAPTDGLPFPCPEGRLVVEHMSFGFRGPLPPLFRNVDLTIEPGEIVAIVGPSGSGKSTLLRILMGITRPSAGGVYLDGHSTHQWNRRDFARHVGFLPQEPLLSRATVAEGIARLEEPDLALVLDAAKRAGAHETIIGLPLGYATPLTGSYQLSMGQRHRLALARTLYGRPRLLVLDELAGSLDAEGEASVARLLARLREEGCSIVFTTHRPNLLAAADRVLAIRNGTVVPAGEEQPRLPGRTARLPRARRQAIAAA